jgi:hypothetical protein
MDKFSSVGNQEQETIDDLYQTYLKTPNHLIKAGNIFLPDLNLPVQIIRFGRPCPGMISIRNLQF